MTSHTIHDADGGIGFDMRNAHLEPYSDSEEEDERVDPAHRPRPYQPKDDGFECNCCYVILIIIIVAIGSAIGYTLGSSFETPKNEFHPQLNHPKTRPPTKYHITRTPEPTRTDPFRNGGVNGLFKKDTDPPTRQTPAPTIKESVPTPKPVTESRTEPTVATESRTEPTATSETRTEPTVASESRTEPTATSETRTEPTVAAGESFTEPTVATESRTEPTVAAGESFTEPTVASQESKESRSAMELATDSSSSELESANESDQNSEDSKESTLSPLEPDYDLTATHEILHDGTSHDIDFDARPLRLGTHDVSTSPVLTKVVLNEYEVPHIFEHSHRFNIKYPHSASTYAPNQYRSWCFHFYLYDFPAAQIDITFKSFQLERGFDRILIRHFNQSFLDPPLVIAGRGRFDEEKSAWVLPEKMTYHLRKNEFKSICVEMETDDSVEMEGVDFTVEVRYDDCLWTEYTDCYIPDESNVHWDRGPWYDGLCGIGVQQRKRMNAGTEQIEGFVRCENADDSDVDGPDYCLKAPWCVFM